MPETLRRDYREQGTGAAFNIGGNSVQQIQPNKKPRSSLEGGAFRYSI